MKSHKKNNTVTRLSLAALALPGLIQTATAGRVDETYNADIQYGYYAESGQRMKVNVYEAALATPIGKTMTASLNLVSDVISGASPIYNNKNSNGQVRQVLSGASIRDERNAITAGLTYFLNSASINVGGGYSTEHDYTSRYFNTNMSLDLNKKLTTLNLGASVAFDEVAPSVSVWNNYGAGFQAHKTSQQYLLGVSQIINKNTIVQSNMTFGYQTGFLSDPYKWVAFYNGNNVSDFQQDKRPNERFQWAWLNQYIQHFGKLNNAALHLDYRFSVDNWGINAHTFEASWYQPVVNNWQIVPHVRYYSQNQADFYQAVFTGNSGNYSAYSSDYRLAGFGVVSGGINLSKEFTRIKALNQLKFQTGIEYYDHKASYELGGNNSGTYGNFSYYLATASINLKF